MFNKRLIVFSWLLAVSCGNRKCSLNERFPKYHLMEKCHRSQMSVIARAHFGSLTSCQQLGVERRGLALNFSPPDATDSSDYNEDEPFYSCEILNCPETDIGLSLVNDTRYDYYSMYADPLPSVNSSCISSVGVFSLEISRLNFTDASNHCQKLKGDLADPSSDTRTNELSSLLSTNRIQVAFVGMRSEKRGSFRTMNGEPLECTTYRAWAPGHPKKRFRNESCVGIDRNKMWKCFRCSQRLPFICELFPNGPYVLGSINVTNMNGTSERIENKEGQ